MERNTGGGLTESRSDEFRGLERLPGPDLLRTLLDGQQAALSAVSAAIPALDRAVSAAHPRLRGGGGRLIYVGAGTSGRLGMLDGVELHPTFGWPADRTLFLLAGGEASLSRAREGAEDDADAGRVAVLEAGCRRDDVMLALAASGTTVFTRAAVAAARERGTLTVGFANNPDSPLLGEAEFGVLLETGPEVLAGSTRLAAGTSQKIALNLFSTSLMIRLGRVYQGQMVDMKATNAKLHRRALTMVSDITGCDEAQAKAALEAGDKQVKNAILIARGMKPEQAEAALEASGGDLAAAIAAVDAGSGASGHHHRD